VQRHSSDFFHNGAQPGGLLTHPGTITQERAKELQTLWESNYGGENAGRIAVLGGEFKYQAIGMMNATDAQLIEQLRWTAENVCTAFHVPPYMIGVGPPPNYNNIEALSVQYYAQCLQNPIEKIEVLLDEGLGLAHDLGVEFDLDDLMRMDTQTRSTVSREAVGSGAVSPNEARQRFWNLPPVAGGGSPYLQLQNYSLEALAKRDAQADPFETDPPTPPQVDDEPEDQDAPDLERAVADLLTKELAA
jgi:HK97 family phage portal protein